MTVFVTAGWVCGTTHTHFVKDEFGYSKFYTDICPICGKFCEEEFFGGEGNPCPLSTHAGIRKKYFLEDCV
jgi:hypothetical protein